MPPVAEDGDQESAETEYREKAEEFKRHVHLPACQVSRTGAAIPNGEPWTREHLECVWHPVGI